MLTETARRQSFPSLATMTYLNTAAEGIPPLEVQAALNQYFADKQLGMDGREAHAAQFQAVRIAAGLDYIIRQGVEAIHAATKPLMQAALDALCQMPVEMLTPASATADSLAGITAFRHPDMDTIQRRLHADNVHVMAHAGRMRLAIYGYNTEADLERFLSVLTGALRYVHAA